MLAEERRGLILELLRQNQRIVAKELAEQLHLSVDSIRRDLTIMEEQGLLKKTYGGAVPLTKLRRSPLPETQRYGEAAPHQNAIAKEAASLIQEGDTVFIGGAGIHYGMLEHLPREIPFTTVTNSLKIAQLIRRLDNIDSYLIGGQLRADSGNMIDALALEQLGRFTFDIGFLTGGGLSSRGLSVAAPAGAGFARAVSGRSRRKVVLAPHEKLGVEMFISSVPIREIDTIITDGEASKAFLHELAATGVQIVVAEAGGNRSDSDTEKRSRP